jgi:1,4-alpha-glucan branching enzyme
MVESALSEFDLFLIGEGTHYRAYEKLGAHVMERDGRRGVQFAIWAPNAMPGDDWQKFANLRLLYGYMFGHPGKKLLFMGNEFGQWSEWNHDASLEWHLLNEPFHAGLKRWVRDLNTLYGGQPLLHEIEFNSAGFEWVDCKDSQRSIISFLRRGQNPNDQLLFVCNFIPVVRENYRVGVPLGCYWKEILNSDASLYGGSGQGNFGGLQAAPLPIHGLPFSLNMTLPPLGILVFQPESNNVA